MCKCVFHPSELLALITTKLLQMKKLDLLSLKELKALRRNYEDLLIKEFDTLTTATREAVEHKIKEVKKMIFLKNQTHY